MPLQSAALTPRPPLSGPLLTVSSRAPSNKYLHLGVRDTSNKVTFGFWSNDLDSGTGADPAATSTTLAALAAGNQWRHLAFTFFQGSNVRDRKIWMNAVLSQFLQARRSRDHSRSSASAAAVSARQTWPLSPRCARLLPPPVSRAAPQSGRTRRRPTCRPARTTSRSEK